ncbi:MAG: DegV family protein [Phototrophicaceae bacterium]
MTKIHIVTDSGASFANQRLLQQYPVTVVPYQIDIGGTRYKEGVDISDEDAMRIIKSQDRPPKLIAPSEEEYAELYANLSRVYDGIISIHTSREITDSWSNARRAAQRLQDITNVVAIDSRSICAGQGMLVRLAGQAALDDVDYESAVMIVRDAVDRIFTTFFVDSLSYLQANHVMSDSRSILGAMLNIKPIISIEEGKPMVTEKVRTRAQAIDRMIEFLTEFDDLDDAMIVQNRLHITEQARQLQDRLSLEFPGRHFPYTMYGMALAVLLGPDATGVMVLESEMKEFIDGE